MNPHRRTQDQVDIDGHGYHGWLRQVPCAHCGARVGKKCLTNSGKTANTLHADRSHLRWRVARLSEENPSRTWGPLEQAESQY